MPVREIWNKYGFKYNNSCGKPLEVRLSGPYREKPDCSSANQIIGFSGKSDREKIKACNHLAFGDQLLMSIFPSIQINTNGVISFNSEVTSFSSDAFPVNNRPLISPFWSDVDTRIYGDIHYRETQEIAILSRFSQEVRKYFVRQRLFSARWALIVTWLNVPAYPGSGTLNVSIIWRANYVCRYTCTVLITKRVIQVLTRK